MTFFRLVKGWILVVIWAGLIFYLSGIPHLKTELGIWDLILRKCAHIFEYFVLTVLMARAYKETWPQMNVRQVIFWCTFLSILYAVSDEIHQGFVPGRGPSVIDVFIDSLGVVLAGVGIKFKYEKI